MSEADAVAGIPAMVNCLIMVPFSIFFHYAYDVGPYIIDRHLESGRRDARYLHYQGGFMGIRALTGMLNPGEMLGAIAFAFKMGRGGKSASARGLNTVTSSESRDLGYSYEMNRGEQRRMNQHGRGDHARRYEHR